MLNIIAGAIIFIFALEGYLALQEIHPNKAAALLAVVVFIGLFKLIKQTRSNSHE